jgi:alpha-tubulin suppressor-like RCC1 family protein
MPSPRYYSIPAGLDMNEDFVREQSLIDQYVGNQIWGLGLNTQGQLGDLTVVRKSSPVQEVLSSTLWKTVSAGRYHSVATRTDGTLWGWGMNNRGQLGKNDVTNRSSPVQEVLAATTWKTVACGYYHTLAIRTDGTLWAWGLNSNGQLGKNDVTHRSSPVQEVLAATTWKTIIAGDYHSASIRTDGTLWLWGRNSQGQLSKSDVVHRSSPVQEQTGGTWIAVACGGNHTSAIKTDGTLWAWGRNIEGQHGDNTNTIHRSSPVQELTGSNNWKFVSAGGNVTSAIKTDGTLWSWGANLQYGQLGDNSLVAKSSPVQTIAGGTNWKMVSIARYMTAAIKTDGTLWTWGNNGQGQLGDNTVVHKSSPIQTVAGGTNWKTVFAGRYHNLAVKFTE